MAEVFSGFDFCGLRDVPLLVEQLLRRAVEWGASDIHVEPAPDCTWIRMRMDGVLQEVARIPRELSPNVVARIKVLAGLLTYQIDRPQDGSIRGEDIPKVPDREVEMRVSTMPVLLGEKAVIRILHVAARRFSLESLGFDGDVLSSVRRTLRQTQGLFLFTGPAGSGKTTSIYAALSHIVRENQGTLNVVTIEDPVECALEGVTQTRVNSGAGLTFANILRSLLRQDPDIIMIGEIRDSETADIAVQVGFAGHLVVSTVHSGRAAGVFLRLLGMGASLFLLRASIHMVIAQRLLRLLCPHCKRKVESPPGCESPEFPAYTAGRCEKCRGTGYQARTMIAEALTLDENLRRTLAEECDEARIEEAAIRSGMRPLPEVARELVRQGRTSLAEIHRVLLLE